MEQFTTTHKLFLGKSQDLSKIPDSSIQLVVTSPPYPMIEMWDDIMSQQNPLINEALQNNNGNLAFELMHKELDLVWNEVKRVLIPGGIVCINIGDATRTLNGNFALYPNHARILSYFISNDFVNLPNIIWRKQTNAPNKFMGSGMLPAGAYVTLEHEWILIFRKSDKREFKTPEAKLKRRESSFFWEERNIWFSDIWDNIKGTKQKMDKTDSRTRSAAFPFEIPYRLINMYSLQGDTVLDPFMGTGTTSIAAIATGRNSIGYEIYKDLLDFCRENILSYSTDMINEGIAIRLNRHKEFITERATKSEIKHFNSNLQMPVMTSQERDIEISYVTNISLGKNELIKAEYSKIMPVSHFSDNRHITQGQYSLF